MTENQILRLIAEGKLPDSQVCQELKQTHISWLILCSNYVYKIKKPLKLSFLDFSSLPLRKYFCEQELILNQRLTSDMYLKVCPVLNDRGHYTMETGTGEIVDYAVAMRRLDNTKEMSKLLPEGMVSKIDIKNISRQLVRFHKNTEVVNGIVTPKVLIEDFNDIQQIQLFITDNISREAAVQLGEIMSFVERFIDEKASLIIERDEEGFTRDCHGDLHSGNIFLLENPVIFDCIEFSKHLRLIDVLCELAFFCMDLEFYQRKDLSKYFMECYTSAFPVIRNKSEEQLFLFYKLYRANVKAKINAIKTQQAHDKHEMQSRLDLFERYYQLFQHYYGLLENSANW